MKKVLLVVGSVLAVIYSYSQLSFAPADGDFKVDMKDGKFIVSDKCKPVRKALEDWYARNKEAFKSKDAAAIMALRTDDVHTITPDGKVSTRADMETRTRLLLDRVDHFISQENQIG